MVVYSNKYTQRHMVSISLVRGIECHAIAEVFIGTSATCIGPEDVLYSVFVVKLEVEKELTVACFHFGKECDQLLHVIDVVLSGVDRLPAVYSRSTHVNLEKFIYEY